ncbi:unnamed protein product [Vicia faba]|uniref:Transmembrane protein n=1 Tax=Vicia faba TaxID=3906 RepID=A0AAV0Z3G5_VICFA|nr:unnamed protein product [Vicia faba]
MASAAFASSPQIATFLSKSSSPSFHFQPRFSSLSLPTTPSFSPIITTPRKSILFQTNSKLLPIPVAAAAVEDVTVDATEQLVSTTDDGVSVIVSVLFFVAFIGLSVITVGVIYLAVTDFLIKREKDKFEKEEAKSGKKKKKRKVIRAGPRRFGKRTFKTVDDD